MLTATNVTKRYGKTTVLDAASLAIEPGMVTAVIVGFFGATQDIAIDALAVNTLPENERATANGFMFAGAYVGQGSTMMLNPGNPAWGTGVPGAGRTIYTGLNLKF